MADEKISAMAELTTPASGDYLPIVDISEAADADKNKRVLWSTITSASAGGMTVQHKSGNYTASAGEIVFCDTNVAAMTITLPATPSGDDRVIVVDAAGNAGTNNITVARNGETILGTAADFVIDQDFGQADFSYEGTDTDWLAALSGHPDVVNVEAYVTGAQRMVLKPDIDLYVETGTAEPGLALVELNSFGSGSIAKVYSFDPSTAEYCYFSWVVPPRWDGGSFRYRFFWVPSNTDTGDVDFNCRTSFGSDGETISDITYRQTNTDNGLGTALNVQVSAWSGLFTSDTLAEGDFVIFTFYRNATSDTFTGDMHLLSIELEYTTDAATDD